MLNRALKVIRKYHNLSQKELANKLEISNSHICEIENNRVSPSLELLNKYATCFNIPLSSIMLFSENIEKDGIKVNKVRKFVANKILKILEWIAETEV